jgi:drug/metabolite transporter (DMT)-like permease
MESLFILFILSIIWGSSFILIKKGLEVFSPVQVGTIRISFAFLVMLPFALSHVKIIPKDKFKFVFFNGMVGNLIPAVLFAIAETELESSLTGILNALSPLFTMLIAVYIFNYTIKFSQIFGIIIGFIGAIGLSFVSATGGLGSMNVYVVLIVIATICYAISLNFIKAYLDGISSFVITSLSMLTVGPISLIYLFFTDFFDKLKNTEGSFESLGYLSILGIFGTAIGLVLYTRLALRTNAVFASSVTYLIPIVAILWGLLDNEVLYPLHFAGMFLILLGIYFVNYD